MNRSVILNIIGKNHTWKFLLLFVIINAYTTMPPVFAEYLDFENCGGFLDTDEIQNILGLDTSVKHHLSIGDSDKKYPNIHNSCMSLFLIQDDATLSIGILVYDTKESAQSFFHNPFQFSSSSSFNPISALKQQGIDVKEDISMIVLLPNEKDGLQSLEQSMDRKTFDSVKDSMTRESLTVQIPRFEFETEYDLIGSLENLGVHDAFDENNADFHGITDAQMYLDKAIHKAFVNVNEEGTEAAAITALVGRFTSGPPEPVAEFAADHPFMFVIQEKNTGEILFVGRLVNP